MTLFLWALAGGVLNRFSGWTDYLPGRNIYYAALAAFGAVWLVYGLAWGLWVFVSLLAYRLPGWHRSLDMGMHGDSLGRDAVVMYLRGLYCAPVFVAAVWMTGSSWPLAYLIGASAGAVLAYIIGNRILNRVMPDPFWFIEFAAGACFGAAIGAAIGAT